MLQLEVLIGELPSIDRLPSSPIVVCEVTTLKNTKAHRCNYTAGQLKANKRERKGEAYLAHELRDHSVES